MSHMVLENNASAHDDEYRTLDPILNAAEKFFISVKDGQYDTAWDLLSEDSHNTIIGDVYEATRKLNENIRREDIIKSFNSRGKMFTNYWNSFQRSFDADIILEKSEWEMGQIKKDEADIIITYNNAEGPTVLKMHRENDLWRVGLTETFWQRKGINLLHLIFQ